jgi:DNA-binding CsgD family transcriptional regulator
MPLHSLDPMTTAEPSHDARDRIHQLWDELAGFGAARSEHALRRAMEVLGELVDAQQAYWMCSVRLGPREDPVHGWRPALIQYLHEEPLAQKTFDEHRRKIERGAVDPSIIANLRLAGSFRINFQHEMVPPDWYESEFYLTYFVPREVHDVAYMVMPLGEDVESWIGFQRKGANRRRFDATDRALLAFAGRSLKWLHRPAALHHGLSIAAKPLTPTERKVLTALLASGSEADIAQELGMTVATVHTYATRIFRKFNVKGRSGLTALWLHQG